MNDLIHPIWKCKADLNYIVYDNYYDDKQLLIPMRGTNRVFNTHVPLYEVFNKFTGKPVWNISREEFLRIPIDWSLHIMCNEHITWTDLQKIKENKKWH